MKNILLVCAAGMSTSMLVKRMQDYAESINVEVNINAMAIPDAKEEIHKNSVDAILLGPQVRYQKSEIEEVTKGQIPLDIIDMRLYGMMDGKSVLEKALAMISEK